MAAKRRGLRQIVTGGKAEEEHCRQSQNEEPMTPKGSILYHSCIDSYILVIIGLNNLVDVPSMKAALQSTVINHSRFSSIVKKGRWGNCKWIRREVDIDKHIIVPDLSYSSTQRMDFVEDYTASLANTALDSSRPLWEIHVLNRKSRSAEAQSASVVFKIHHCIGDCVSLMSLFLECTRKVSDPQSLPTIQHHPRPANINKHPICRNSRISAFHTIWNAIFVVWCTLVDLLKGLATFLCMKDNIIPRRSGRSQPKRLAHVTMDLEDVGIVRKAVNGTVNEVVTGILSAGFVRYLSRHYESKQ